MIVDARGMRCPWPALRLAKALRASSQRVELLADDPNAERECAAVAAAAGYAFRRIGEARFQAVCVNTSFTADA